MSNHVFVIDTNKKPLLPCHPGVARSLLKAGKAAIFRMYPFTIILKKAVEAQPESVQLKIDPGSVGTGMALVKDGVVLWAANLMHRGQAIKQALEQRKAIRRNRRNSKTRYRKARFLNRTRPKGWLAPSLQHRVDTTLTWVKRLIKYVPISGNSQELVKFDTQKLQNPEISGIEYQQGELLGYEVREYLLEKWQRKCTYCDKTEVPLQVEHIVPKVKGGSNRISNLCLSCEKCNQKKGTKDIQEFLKKKPELLKKIQATARITLKDAAAVNSTRWVLFNRLRQTTLPVQAEKGSQTKYNRMRFEFPKEHWIDAACLGNIDSLELATNQPLIIIATGHGTRQKCRTDQYGFPARYVPQKKFVEGFQTGDIVKAVVTKGKKVGTYFGRVAVRSSGSFNIKTNGLLIQGISHKYCQLIHKKDGYAYSFSGGCAT